MQRHAASQIRDRQKRDDPGSAAHHWRAALRPGYVWTLDMPEPFSLARRLRAGETVFTAWCAAASPLVAETIARAGYEAAILDSQHGLWDMASLIAGIGAVHHAGAEETIAPITNTQADARASSPPPSIPRSASAAGVPCAPCRCRAAPSRP